MARQRMTAAGSSGKASAASPPGASTAATTDNLHAIIASHQKRVSEFSKSWKNMLRIFVFVFCGAAVLSMQRLEPKSPGVLFEVGSIAGVAMAFGFVERWGGAVQLFQGALLVALLQGGWWAWSLYSEKVLDVPLPPKFRLEQHQIPVCTLYFFVAWGIDRMTLRSSMQIQKLQSQAKELESKSK